MAPNVCLCILFTLFVRGTNPKHISYFKISGRFVHEMLEAYCNERTLTNDDVGFFCYFGLYYPRISVYIQLFVLSCKSLFFGRLSFTHFHLLLISCFWFVYHILLVNNRMPLRWPFLLDGFQSPVSDEDLCSNRKTTFLSFLKGLRILCMYNVLTLLFCSFSWD